VIKGPTLVAKNATRMGHPSALVAKNATRMGHPPPKRGRLFPLIAHVAACHFVTRKTTLLLSTFLGVVTSTVPVVAPAGTVVVIAVPELLTANTG